MENRPAKRHPSLQPLSRHHHHALVVAQMLILQQEPQEEIKDKLKDFWVNGGREHFREEEEYLLPEYAKYQSLDRPEIYGLLVEHVKIRSLISGICADGNLGKMKELGEMLKEHIRKEERVVFPMIQEGVPEESLRKLEPLFSEHIESSLYMENDSKLR